MTERSVNPGDRVIGSIIGRLRVAGVVGWVLPLVLVFASCDGRPGESTAGPVTEFDGPQSGESRRGSDTGTVADSVAEKDAADLLPTRSYPLVKAAAEADHMRGDDLVFGVVISGAARAYPWWVMKNYHAVNDAIGDTPVLITLCEQCSAAGAFRRVVGDRALMMEMMGVYKGTIILRDRQTRSLWNPFDGIALEGPLAGAKLDRLPLFLTRWDDWKVRHPQTDVAWDDQRHRYGHGAWYEPGKWGIVNMMGQTIETWDTRLAENELVYGIRHGDLAVAYPGAALDRAGGVVNEQVGQTPVVVMKRGSFEMVGYDRRVGDRTLSFERADAAGGRFKDRQTGSLWDIEGNAVSGSLAGHRLRRLDGYMTEWHVWFGYHPKTQIFGPTASESYSRFTFPPLALTALDGSQRQPVRLCGKVNLVVLWAVWCPPCREELPQLQSVFEAHADRGVSVVSIAVHIPDKDEQRAVREFVAETKLRLPVFFIDEPSYQQLDSLLRQSGGPGIVLPTVFVADDRRTVRAVLRGKELTRLPKLIEELLGEGAEPSDFEPVQ